MEALGSSCYIEMNIKLSQKKIPQLRSKNKRTLVASKKFGNFIKFLWPEYINFTNLKCGINLAAFAAELALFEAMIGPKFNAIGVSSV